MPLLYRSLAEHIHTNKVICLQPINKYFKVPSLVSRKKIEQSSNIHIQNFGRIAAYLLQNAKVHFYKEILE